MATIDRSGITGGGTIQATHITNIIDALDGTSATTTVVATGSFSGSLVGELTGTASFASTATSSSYAITASYALNGGGGGGGIFAVTGSTYATTNNLEITGSLQVTAGVTASLQGTASYSNVARNAEVARVGTNAAFYPVLVDSANASATAEALKSTTYLTINPSTDTISGATVSGSLNVSSSMSAQSDAQIIFNSIGTQGNFCIPIAAPSNPTAGSMYWDDSNNILYIYSATNAGWYNVGLNP